MYFKYILTDFHFKTIVAYVSHLKTTTALFTVFAPRIPSSRPREQRGRQTECFRGLGAGRAAYNFQHTLKVLEVGEETSGSQGRRSRGRAGSGYGPAGRRASPACQGSSGAASRRRRRRRLQGAAGGGGSARQRRGRRPVSARGPGPGQGRGLRAGGAGEELRRRARRHTARPSDRGIPASPPLPASLARSVSWALLKLLS